MVLVCMFCFCVFGVFFLNVEFLDVWVFLLFRGCFWVIVGLSRVVWKLLVILGGCIDGGDRGLRFEFFRGRFYLFRGY